MKNLLFAKNSGELLYNDIHKLHSNDDDPGGGAPAHDWGEEGVAPADY